MAEVYVNPFEFVEEAYKANPETVDLSESFLDELFASDSDGSEAEFDGFTREEIYLAPGSRVRAFHERCADEEQNKENRDSRREKKTTRSLKVRKLHHLLKNLVGLQDCDILAERMPLKTFF